MSSLPPLAEADYIALAEPEPARLLAALDQLGEGLEAELASDIITIEFPDGGRFVLNSHRAARQIWMAAGTQAWHFDFVREQNRWVALKNGDELWTCLGRVLSEKLGRRVTLATA